MKIQIHLLFFLVILSSTLNAQQNNIVLNAASDTKTHSILNSFKHNTFNQDLTGTNNITRNLVIIEDFTATWCGYCPIAARACDDLVENGYPVGIIAYHGTDDYENTDGAYRIDNYYEVTGFPTVYIDGIIQTGVSGNTYNTFLNYVNQRMAVTTPISIELINENYNENTRTFTADVLCEALNTISSDDLVLHASISESHIPEVWMDNEQELNFVERKMFPDAQGSSIDLINNTQQTIPIEFILDENWVAELCEIVVFVQDISSKEIFNADKTNVKELTELPDATVIVTDFNGSPVEGASVNFGEMQGTTNAVGEIIFADIEPGPYWYNATKEYALPLADSCAVMQAEDKIVPISLHLTNLLFSEDFSGNFPADGWTLEGDQVSNWSHNDSDYAGGEAPELQFSWAPEMTGYSECISPIYDISTASNVSIMVKNTAYTWDDSYNFSLKFLTSYDGLNWDSLSIFQSPGYILKYQAYIELANDYITAGQVQVKFHFIGESAGLFDWSIDDMWIIEEFTTSSVNENRSENISIYPNPASDKILISNIKQAKVNIYNISGQLVMTKENINSSNSIDISELTNGIYIIKVKTDTRIFSSKINIIR